MRFVSLVLLLLLLAVPGLSEDSVSWSTVNPGKGRSLLLGDTAAVSFRLTLGTGELIQEMSELKPLSFEVGADTVIPGLSQGVLGMKRGETRHLRIPASLAYGAAGKGPIPPNSDLLFELTLVDLKSPVLAEQFRDERFLAARHANSLSKPAVFEYLIRDFFTKPWRYADGHLKVWRSASWVTVIAVLLLVVAVMGRRKGVWL